MPSEIEKRGLRSLRRLHRIAEPLPEDAPIPPRPLPEAEGTFLVDAYIDIIPLRKDVDRARKLTYVRYAVCSARTQANTKLGQYKSLIESKLQLKSLANDLLKKRKSILNDRVNQSYLAHVITTNLATIARCEQLLPEACSNISNRRRPTQESIFEQNIAAQLKLFENGLARSGNSVILAKQLLHKADLRAGTKLDIQKKTFVSEIVSWWFRNTGKWPTKNYNAKAHHAADKGALNFYDFLEAARQDAGFIEISSSNTGASGPFERMVRDVISDLKPEMDRRAPVRQQAQCEEPTDPKR